MPSIVMENIQNSYFLVPTELADRYLNKANEAQLKVILYLLRNSGRAEKEEEIAKNLKLTVRELGDAIKFWLDNNVLIKRGERLSINTVDINAPKRPEYTSEVIAFKVSKEPRLASLLEETERIFGKLLSPSDINSLFTLYDWVGLDPDVILMVVSHCYSNGQKGMKYIERTAVEWFEAGIDTVEKAENHIKTLEEKKSMISKISSVIGANGRALTELEAKSISAWINEYGFGLDIIKKAYDTTVNTSGKYSISYMNTILRSWNDKGYKTIAEIDEQAKSFKQSRKKKTAAIDVNEYFENSWNVISDGE